ncbi:uncharacterized protein CLUP02_03201 [Colletotrichum lupini]|uniref:Uncharacterized protein n=1 Tax=Colletotrichum lupini TaxID=145971 RepID=A0A9Q8SID6_9PEZI|nr:uncharacterized protein CLUP02_03201 [Colletotrichum lupini]UQC77730.1 hypothetical protein CLUP02_03201 [Colletotrichum lupini]
MSLPLPLPLLAPARAAVLPHGAHTLARGSSENNQPTRLLYPHDTVAALVSRFTTCSYSTQTQSYGSSQLLQSELRINDHLPRLKLVDLFVYPNSAVDNTAEFKISNKSRASQSWGWKRSKASNQTIRLRRELSSQCQIASPNTPAGMITQSSIEPASASQDTTPFTSLPMRLSIHRCLLDFAASFAFPFPPLLAYDKPLPCIETPTLTFVTRIQGVSVAPLRLST